MALPAAAAARAVVKKKAPKKAPKKGAPKKTAPPASSSRKGPASRKGPSAPGGGGGGQRPDRPWRDPGRTKKSTVLKGPSGGYRKWLIAEFVICVMLLGLSPLAKKPGEMGPRRFMKRGSATCALFIILGLVSAAGRGAAKAAAAFGALVTLVLLVDQREAFGALAKTLNTTEADEKADAEAAAALLGPDDSTDADDAGPGVMAV